MRTLPAQPRSPASSDLSTDKTAVSNPRGARSAQFAALAAVIAVAAALRFVNLGAKSIWSDEAFSVFLAGLSWQSFWHVVSTAEANMSAYYVLLRGWIHFGDEAFWVRLLSALISVAAVPVVYWIGTDNFSRRAGILAALLLAINPFDIRYAQEARSYSLLAVLVSISLLAFFVCLRRPSRFWSVCYVLSTALALYAHFFAALAVLVQLVSLAALPAESRQVAKAQALRMGIVILLGLPLLWFVLFRDQGQLGWAPAVHARDVYDVFRFMVGSGVKLGIAVAAAAIAVTAWIRNCRDKGWTTKSWPLLVVILWLFLPVFLTLLLSVWKPMYAPRFLIFCLPAALLLVAQGLAEVRFVSVRYVLVLALIVGEMGPIRSYYAEPGQEDWKGVVQFFSRNFHAGDAAVLPNGYCNLPFEYELQHGGTMISDLRIISMPTETQASEPNRLWIITCSATKNLDTQLALSAYQVVEEKQFKGVQITEARR